MATLSIKAAADKFNKHPHYIRKLVREGKVESSLQPSPHNSNIKRHEIDEESLTSYLSTSGGRGRRDDGRRKFTLYLDVNEELPVVEEFLNQHGITRDNGLFDFANPGRPTQ